MQTFPILVLSPCSIMWLEIMTLSQPCQSSLSGLPRHVRLGTHCIDRVLLLRLLLLLLLLRRRRLIMEALVLYVQLVVTMDGAAADSTVIITD